MRTPDRWACRKSPINALRRQSAGATTRRHSSRTCCFNNETVNNCSSLRAGRICDSLPADVDRTGAKVRPSSQRVTRPKGRHGLHPRGGPSVATDGLPISDTRLKHGVDTTPIEINKGTASALRAVRISGHAPDRTAADPVPPVRPMNRRCAPAGWDAGPGA